MRLTFANRARGVIPLSTVHGGLAQLGERLHGMQEVIGSSPLSSICEANREQTGESRE